MYNVSQRHSYGNGSSEPFASDVNHSEEKKTGYVADAALRPIDIKARLDEYVVGQDNAKRAIAVAMYNHYKRITFGNPDIKKSNILLVGPTGSGKTYLVETLARIMNMPVALCTATSLTEAGYIGDDVESVVAQLYEVCERDRERTEHGIIFIDEIDKLSSAASDTEKKVGGKGVQQALLRLLEGSKVYIPVGDGPAGGKAKIEIDTSNILFICGGAFPDAEKIIAKRLNKKEKAGIGFTGEVDKKDSEITKDLLKYVTTDDLRNFGMIPEFLGRLPVITSLDELSVDALADILTKPKANLLWQYQKLLSYDGIQLDMTEGAIRKVAEIAVEKGTGARSLRSIMEDVLQDLMFSLPGSDVESVTITEEFVAKTGAPVIRTKGASSGMGYGTF